MTARILDGKALADQVREEVRRGAAAFTARHGRAPGLDVVLVGDDPASVVYTRNKEKACREVGLRGRLHILPASASEEEVLALVRTLNDDDEVDGVLVQLPLPDGLSERRVLDAVRFDKDVDGLHPTNAGLLALGRPALAPCTPLGVMRLLASAEVPLAGARAVVVGRSSLVGRPVAQLLLAANATVTVTHTHTKNLEAICREADVLVVAAGKRELVRGSWIKPGATVIDVGIHRIDDGSGKTKLVGDVAGDEARAVAGALSPVPGGVGPLTIAHLLHNTLRAAELRHGAKAVS